MKKLFLLLTLSFALGSCNPVGGFKQGGGGDTQAGNPNTQEEVAVFANGFRSDDTGSELALRLCVVEIGFVKDTADQEVFWSKLRDVDREHIISDSGNTLLAEMSIPAGNYLGLILELEPLCAEEVSAVLTNLNGSFKTTETGQMNQMFRFQIQSGFGAKQEIIYPINRLESALREVSDYDELIRVLFRRGSTQP